MRVTRHEQILKRSVFDCSLLLDPFRCYIECLQVLYEDIIDLQS